MAAILATGLNTVNLPQHPKDFSYRLQPPVIRPRTASLQTYYGKNSPGSEERESEEWDLRSRPAEGRSSSSERDEDVSPRRQPKFLVSTFPVATSDQSARSYPPPPLRPLPPAPAHADHKPFPEIQLPESQTSTPSTLSTQYDPASTPVQNPGFFKTLRSKSSSRSLATVSSSRSTSTNGAGSKSFFHSLRRKSKASLRGDEENKGALGVVGMDDTPPLPITLNHSPSPPAVYKFSSPDSSSLPRVSSAGDLYQTDSRLSSAFSRSSQLSLSSYTPSSFPSGSSAEEDAVSVADSARVVESLLDYEMDPRTMEELSGRRDSEFAEADLDELESQWHAATVNGTYGSRGSSSQTATSRYQLGDRPDYVGSSAQHISTQRHFVPFIRTLPRSTGLVTNFNEAWNGGAEDRRKMALAELLDSNRDGSRSRSRRDELRGPSGGSVPNNRNRSQSYSVGRPRRPSTAPSYVDSEFTNPSIIRVKPKSGRRSSVSSDIPNKPSAQVREELTTDPSTIDRFAIPEDDVVAKAMDMKVYDASGKKLRFSQVVWRDPGGLSALENGKLRRRKRTVVIFLRYWWCGLCQEYLQTLSAPFLAQRLAQADVKLVAIGHGSPFQIPRYLASLNPTCPYELYTDPSLETYSVLGMNLRTLKYGSGLKWDLKYPLDTEPSTPTENDPVEELEELRRPSSSTASTSLSSPRSAHSHTSLPTSSASSSPASIQLPLPPQDPNKERGDWQKMGMVENVKKSAINAAKIGVGRKGGWGLESWEDLITGKGGPGDQKVVGGEFVFESLRDGTVKCIYASRMTTTRNHADIPSLFAAAGVDIRQAKGLEKEVAR